MCECMLNKIKAELDWGLIAGKNIQFCYKIVLIVSFSDARKILWKVNNSQLVWKMINVPTDFKLIYPVTGYLQLIQYLNISVFFFILL